MFRWWAVFLTSLVIVLAGTLFLVKIALADRKPALTPAYTVQFEITARSVDFIILTDGKVNKEEIARIAEQAKEIALGMGAWQSATENARAARMLRGKLKKEREKK